MRPRAAAPEIVAAIDAERALVLVAECTARLDVRLPVDPGRDARKNVDDRLRGEPRDGGAPDVLEPQRKSVTRALDAIRFRGEFRGPQWIVW